MSDRPNIVWIIPDDEWRRAMGLTLQTNSLLFRHKRGTISICPSPGGIPADMPVSGKCTLVTGAMDASDHCTPSQQILDFRTWTTETLKR
jgi:hypothetical protein